VSLIVVELLASSEGIGYLMVWGRQLFQLDIVFVTIAVVGLSGMLMEWAANRVYARLVFWPQPRRTAGLEAAGQLACIPAAADPAGAVAAGKQLGLDRWHIILFAAGGGAALYGRSGQRRLTAAMLASLGRAFAGGALGIAIGLLCGLLLALRPRAGQILTPTLNVLRHIALFAWLPLLTAWVGNDNGGKIVFIALASFFPMFFSTLQAVQPARSAA
jgi:sulfonate transport system permease protein